MGARLTKFMKAYIIKYSYIYKINTAFGTFSCLFEILLLKPFLMYTHPCLLQSIDINGKFLKLYLFYILHTAHGKSSPHIMSLPNISHTTQHQIRQSLKCSSRGPKYENQTFLRGMPNVS